MANYLKQGTNDNFIFDSAEIELAKFNNLRYSVMGYMLGDFDEHGIYTVDKEIVKELISMRKYVASAMDNVEICHSEIKLINPITFLVTFEEDCATLSLVEKISHEGNFKENGGSFSDINEYVLDRVQTSGVINKEVVYRRWNIGEYSGNVLDINSLDEETKAQLFGLTNRFKYLLYVNTAILEREEELEQEELNYAEDLAKLLIGFPKLKAAVDKSVKEKLDAKKDFVRIDKPFVTRTLNEIVEQAIAENINVLKPKELEKFKAAKHEIVNQHNLRMSAILPIVVEKSESYVNAENSVGVVKVDTEALTVAALPEIKVPEIEVPQVEVQETAVVADLPRLHRRREERFSIIDLQKGLVGQHKKVEEELTNSAVKFIKGQATEADGGKHGKDGRVERLFGVGKNNVSNATRRRAEQVDEKGKSLKGESASTTDKKPAGKNVKKPGVAKTAAQKSADKKPEAKKSDGKKASGAKAETKKSTPSATAGIGAGTKGATSTGFIGRRISGGIGNEAVNQKVAENPSRIIPQTDTPLNKPQQPKKKKKVKVEKDKTDDEELTLIKIDIEATKEKKRKREEQKNSEEKNASSINKLNVEQTEALGRVNLNRNNDLNTTVANKNQEQKLNKAKNGRDKLNKIEDAIEGVEKRESKDESNFDFINS